MKDRAGRVGERTPTVGARRAVLRARVGVGIVLAFGLVSAPLALDELRSGAAGVTSYGPVTERFNAQYEALRDSLPARGPIGFVSDAPDDLPYVLAHYNLAPLLVKDWGQERVVVGHFGSDEAARRFLQGEGPEGPIPAGATRYAIVVPR
jgi:hypothetical protein